MQGSITVKGSKELIATLGMFSSRVGSSLVVAIKDGLRPVVPAMRSAIIQVVGNGKKSSKHWSVSETDYKERALKSGKKKRTLSSAELIRAVEANPKHLGKVKFRKQFAKDKTLQAAGSTGMLAKSVAIKAKAKKAKVVGQSGSKTLRQSQNAAQGWVGPSNTEMVGMSAWTKRPILIVPTRYSHLVNNGHRLKIGKRVLGMVKPRPFLQPVIAQHSRGIEARIEASLRAEISKAASNGGRR